MLPPGVEVRLCAVKRWADVNERFAAVLQHWCEELRFDNVGDWVTNWKELEPFDVKVLWICCEMTLLE